MNDLSYTKTKTMKQTAVEWLIEKLMKGEFINSTNELIEQAKQMEAEQSKIPELSDDEIITESDKSDLENNRAGNYFEYQAGFIHGAKWYREQLKQRQ